MRLILAVLASFVFAGMVSADIVDITASVRPDEIVRGEHFELSLTVKIKEGYHINGGRSEFDIPMEVEIAPVKDIILRKPSYPAPKMKSFSFSPEEIPVYGGTIRIPIRGAVTQNAQTGPILLTGKLHYQACDDDSCLTPDSVSFAARAKIAERTVAAEEPFTRTLTEAKEAEEAAASPSLPDEVDPPEYVPPSPPLRPQIETKAVTPELDVMEEDKDNHVAALVRDRGLPVAFAVIFGAGVALSFTPCVFPMIPVVVGWFMVQGTGSRGKVGAMAGLFVLGLAITYAILGLSASKAGAMLGATLQHPAALIGVAGVLVLLALSMFGLFEIRPPSFIANRSGGREGVLGMLLMGALFGIVVAPCVGPFVLALLLYVGQMGQPMLGFWMFFVLALGLGLPFFGLAVFSGVLVSIPAAGAWMVSVRRVFGVVLVGMALYFVRPIMPMSIADYVFIAFFVLAGLYIGWLDKSMADIRTARVLRPVFGVAIAVIGIGSLMQWSKAETVDFVPYSPAALEVAREARKPVILHFSADWCKPCKKMESGTFTRSEVRKEGARFIWIKADLTERESPEVERLRMYYGIKGVPTVILIGSDGVEKERLVGYIGPDDFLKKIVKVR